MRNKNFISQIKKTVKPVSCRLLQSVELTLYVEFPGSFKNFENALNTGIHSSWRHKIGTWSRIFYSFVFYVKRIIAFLPSDIFRVCKNQENQEEHDSSLFWSTLERLRSHKILDILQYHPLRPLKAWYGQRRTCSE